MEKDSNFGNEFEKFFEALYRANIEVGEQDSVEVVGYTLLVHKDGMAGQVKGTVKLSHSAWRQLLKAMVEDGIEIKDWSCVDLSWVVED